MDDRIPPYSREQALADGVLLDVTDLSPLPYPVAVSTGLWNRPEIGRDPENLAGVMSSVARGWSDRGRSPGRWKQLAISIEDGEPVALHVRVIVEPSEAHGMVFTLVDDFEEYDLRGPRPPGGSFHTN